MTPELKNQRLGWMAILAGAACIGLAPIWVRYSEIGPVATAFHRLFLALPFLWVWSGIDRRQSLKHPASPRPRPAMKWMALAGVLFALDMAFWHESLHHTTVANATLLTNAAPIFVTLAARFLFQEVITKTFVIGMCVTFMGALMLTGASWSTSSERLYGDGVALIAALFYAGYMLSIKQLRRHLNTAPLMARTALFSAMVLGVMAWGMEEPLIPASAGGWGVLIALALTGQVLGQGLIAFGFAHLPASFSAVSLLLQPLVAAVAAWLLLKESMSPLQLVGGGVILAGILMARRASG